jgi:hypothetical protein
MNSLSLLTLYAHDFADFLAPYFDYGKETWQSTDPAQHHPF